MTSIVLALGDVVAVLHGGDGHDPPGSLDLLDADLGDPDMADDATVDVGPDRAEALLERRLGIDAVQVVQADGIGPERAQALLDLRAQDLRPALAGAVAALGGDEHLFAHVGERLAEGALAVPAAVEVRGVDVAHACGHGLSNERDVLRCCREAVGAEPDARHLEAGKLEGSHLYKARPRTIRVAAAGQPRTNPKKGPKSRVATKPGMKRPGTLVWKCSSSVGKPSVVSMRSSSGRR